MKLGKLTDYAAAVMAELARSAGGKPRSASSLATATGLPEPTVAKVLKVLAREGLVTAQRGVTGGYSLAKPAADISIADIIVAMEGPIAVTACVDNHVNVCGAEHTCQMRGNWDRVNMAIRHALEEISLAEIAQPARRFYEIQPESGVRA